MQDGKALQAGTSHFLGQNFGKAFDVTFIDKNGKSDYAWATSWGVSTRLIGALIMSHSDDNGLVLPPHLAPIQVVIVPIYRSNEQLAQISEKVAGIVARLKALGISVKYDDADNRKPGWKFAEYELKGVPVRLAMGGRDLENGTIEVMRRDTLEKETRSCEGILGRYARDRGAYQERDEGDDPLPAFGGRHDTGQVYGDRKAFSAPGIVRESVLISI